MQSEILKLKQNNNSNNNNIIQTVQVEEQFQKTKDNLYNDINVVNIVEKDLTSRLMKTKIVRIYPSLAYECCYTQGFNFDIFTVDRIDNQNKLNENEQLLF